MPLQDELVLVDTNVFLAKWLDTDVIYQRVDSDGFFDSAKICHYCIALSEIVLDEISRKYSYLEPNFNEFIQELLEQNKLCKLEEQIREKEVKQVKGDALSKGFTISKKDAYLAILANKKKIQLVSFDQKLVDYCTEIGWKVDYPTNLIKLEKI